MRPEYAAAIAAREAKEQTAAITKILEGQARIEAKLDAILAPAPPAKESASGKQKPDAGN